MKTRLSFLFVAMALLFFGCQKSQETQILVLPDDPFEAYPFVKHVSVSDIDGANDVVLKIGARSQAELDSYVPSDYVLIPEYEQVQAEHSAGTTLAGHAAPPSLPDGVLIKVVVQNLGEDVQTFRIQPKDMEVSTTGKNNSEPISFEIREQYLAAWCMQGSFYAYYYVDDVYRYAIFMTPGQAGYGLDYSQPYEQRVDLYVYEAPAKVQIYAEGERKDYEL